MNSTEYTKTTKSWLDDRFKLASDEGIYIAHQPIYGFRKGYSESGNLKRYVITNQIIKALSNIEFSSLVDIGGAEGYKCAMIKKLLHVENVLSCDLSNEACKRANEIYNIESQVIDIHHLPFDDNSFDVAVCSETLEHVEDLELATKELLRVAKKAVVITVPHESKRVIEKNKKNKIPHAHIHSLNKHSFDFTLSEVKMIHHHNMLSKLMKPFFILVDAQKLPVTQGFTGMLKRIFNRMVPALEYLFGMNALRFAIWKDELVANIIPWYEGLTFILILDENAYKKKKVKKYTVQNIVKFSVPFHYLK